MKKLLVALPCYNEEENIERLLSRFVEFNKKNNDLKIDILLVDDGSRDQTVAKAKNFSNLISLRIISHEVNQGLDGVLKTAFEAFNKEIASKNEYSAFGLMDGDDSHPPDYFKSMWTKLNSEKLDIVIASRFRSGAKIHGVVWWRQVLSFGMALMFKGFRNMKGVMDYSCGYRLYSPEIVQSLIDTYGRNIVMQHNFSCMVELLRNCYDLGAKCGEVPFTLRYDLKKGPSKMQFARTIKGTLKVLLEPRSMAQTLNKDISSQ